MWQRSSAAPPAACLGHRCAWLGGLECQEQLHALALHHLRLQGQGTAGGGSSAPYHQPSLGSWPRGRPWVTRPLTCLSGEAAVICAARQASASCRSSGRLMCGPAELRCTACISSPAAGAPLHMPSAPRGWHRARLWGSRLQSRHGQWGACVDSPAQVAETHEAGSFPPLHQLLDSLCTLGRV